MGEGGGKIKQDTSSISSEKAVRNLSNQTESNLLSDNYFFNYFRWGNQDHELPNNNQNFFREDEIKSNNQSKLIVGSVAKSIEKAGLEAAKIGLDQKPGVFDYDTAIKENKKNHAAGIYDDYFEDIQLILEKLDNQKLSNLYWIAFNKGEINRDFVDFVLILQETLFPNRPDLYNGIFGYDEEAKIYELIQNERIKQNIKYEAGELLPKTETKWKDEAILMNWKAGHLKKEKEYYHLLDLLLHSTKYVPLYEKASENGVWQHQFFHFFVEYVKKGQELIFPNRRGKHTGILDFETLFILRGLSGQFQEPYPNWVKKAISYNKKYHNYTEGLLWELYKISTNRILYNKAKREQEIGAPFVLLVWTLQLKLFRDQAKEQDGKLGPTTIGSSELVTILSAILEKEKEFHYFNVETIKSVKSKNRWELYDIFSKEIIGKPYRGLTIREYDSLLLEIPLRFIEAGALEEYLKSNGYNLDIARFESMNNQFKRTILEDLVGFVKWAPHIFIHNILKPFKFTTTFRRFDYVRSIYRRSQEEELGKLTRYLQLQRKGYELGGLISRTQTNLENNTNSFEKLPGNKNSEENDFLEGLEIGIKTLLPVNPKYKGEFWADTLPRIAGEMVVDLTAEIFARVVQLPPGIASTALNYVRNYRQGFQLGAQTTGNQEVAYEVAESFGLIAIASGFLGGPGKKLFSSFETKSLRKVLFKNILEEGLGKEIRSMVQEGVEEFTISSFSGIMQNLTIRDYIDASREFIDQNLWKEAGAEAIIAMLLQGFGRLKSKQSSINEKKKVEAVEKELLGLFSKFDDGDSKKERINEGSRQDQIDTNVDQDFSLNRDQVETIKDRNQELNQKESQEQKDREVTNETIPENKKELGNPTEVQNLTQEKKQELPNEIREKSTSKNKQDIEGGPTEESKVETEFEMPPAKSKSGNQRIEGNQIPPDLQAQIDANKLLQDVVSLSEREPILLETLIEYRNSWNQKKLKRNFQDYVKYRGLFKKYRIALRKLRLKEAEAIVENSEYTAKLEDLGFDKIELNDIVFNALNQEKLKSDKILDYVFQLATFHRKRLSTPFRGDRYRFKYIDRLFNQLRSNNPKKYKGAEFALVFINEKNLLGVIEGFEVIYPGRWLDILTLGTKLELKNWERGAFENPVILDSLLLQILKDIEIEEMDLKQINDNLSSSLSKNKYVFSGDSGLNASQIAEKVTGRLKKIMGEMEILSKEEMLEAEIEYAHFQNELEKAIEIFDY